MCTALIHVLAPIEASANVVALSPAAIRIALTAVRSSVRWTAFAVPVSVALVKMIVVAASGELFAVDAAPAFAATL
jgi:hypothetical protein